MAAFNQDFNHQSLFMFTLIPRSTYFLLVRKIMLFSYEKVVIRNLIHAVDFTLLYMLNDCL